MGGGRRRILDRREGKAFRWHKIWRSRKFSQPPFPLQNRHRHALAKLSNFSHTFSWNSDLQTSYVSPSIAFRFHVETACVPIWKGFIQCVRSETPAHPISKEKNLISLFYTPERFVWWGWDGRGGMRVSIIRCPFQALRYKLYVKRRQRSL